MWTVSILEDPLQLSGRQDPQGVLLLNKLVHASLSLEDFVNTGDGKHWEAFQEGGRTARVAVTDFIARHLQKSGPLLQKQEGLCLWLETLDKTTSSTSRIRRRNRNGNASLPPYMFERTDIWFDQEKIHIYLRILCYADPDSMSDIDLQSKLKDGTFEKVTVQAVNGVLQSTFDLQQPGLLNTMMRHVAVAVFQDKLRQRLTELNAVAFVADGSILPRKSGASSAPMTSPPAVPFAAPSDSEMNRTIDVEMGMLRPYLAGLPALLANGHQDKTTATLSGLLIPRGITLIVGGGYHGKSTLLRCIAAGVYNKIPGDGREFCTTVNDAVTVRAEDGRYVNNCNVSAFISNLPTPPGVTKALDTTHFSSGEASGSTSQAANVVEAIEMGSSAFLVDEDVSAANFMARDGRMRALVMDESITPLLYRVNGLYKAHGISSIVVVGGVGDWLDVPDAVILMDKYSCKDATKKARSVSKQFSHGHVQYAGRGVVHRLDWETSTTPIPRRPTDSFASLFDSKDTAISILDGGHAVSLHEHHEDEEDSERYIELSRCEQLLGKKPQLYACGLCVVWLLGAAKRFPNLGIPELLDKLDDSLDEMGLLSIVQGIYDQAESSREPLVDSTNWKLLIEALGCAYRPRRFEVGQALTRLRGITFEELPVEEDETEIAARADAERKKQELLDLWNSRRKNKLNGVE